MARLASLLSGLAVLAASACLPASPQEEERGPPLDLSGYVLTFEEAFDTLDVSAWGPGTRWIAHTPWDGDFGRAEFADPRKGFPFTLEDGILRIEARRDRFGRWKAGLLASVDPDFNGFTQQYGYFEISAKLPAGDAVWPAFWLVGRSETHTAEVDVIEHYGRFPGRYSISVHDWDRKDGSKSRSRHHRTSVAPGRLYDGFHTYGVEITEDEMRFYFDREQVWSLPTPELHKRPMAVLLNLALDNQGSLKKTPSPSYMYVDYVRVWQHESRLSKSE